MQDGLIFVLLGVGLFFALTMGLVQLRLFGRSTREILGGRKQGDDPHGITPFQTFVTGLASRVSVGNIADMAVVISVGGPGAVFWMWLVALIGTSSVFTEPSLARLFKIRDYGDRHFHGGPACYTTQGLGQHWLDILFALGLIFCFGFVYELVQANSIVAAMEVVWGWDKHTVSAALMILTASIVFGGIRRVARQSEMIVPVMATLYLLMTLHIVATNIGMVPKIFDMIFNNTFKFDATGGGLLGGPISQTMVMGIKRGLHSSEVGQGSASNAAAAAEVKHPVSQDMVQMLGVFVDTMIVCSCAVFIVLMSDLPADSDLNGVQLARAAIVNHVDGWGVGFLVVVLFMLAFSTIIGNCAYAESSAKFIKSHWLILSLFHMDVLGMVYFGAVNSVPLVWDMAGMAMSTMAWINLIAVLLLSPLVFLLLGDYMAKLKIGKDPQFKLSEYLGLKRKTRSDI